MSAILAGERVEWRHTAPDGKPAVDIAGTVVAVERAPSSIQGESGWSVLIAQGDGTLRAADASNLRIMPCRENSDLFPAVAAVAAYASERDAIDREKFDALAAVLREFGLDQSEWCGWPVVIDSTMTLLGTLKQELLALGAARDEALARAAAAEEQVRTSKKKGPKGPGEK